MWDKETKRTAQSTKNIKKIKSGEKWPSSGNLVEYMEVRID